MNLYTNDAEAIFRDSIIRLEAGREFREEQIQLKSSLIQILNASDKSPQEKINMSKHIGSYLRDILPEAKIERSSKERISDMWQKLKTKFVKETSRNKSHIMIKSFLQGREIESDSKIETVNRKTAIIKSGFHRI